MAHLSDESISFFALHGRERIARAVPLPHSAPSLELGWMLKWANNTGVDAVGRLIRRVSTFF